MVEDDDEDGDGDEDAALLVVIKLVGTMDDEGMGAELDSPMITDESEVFVDKVTGAGMIMVVKTLTWVMLVEVVASEATGLTVDAVGMEDTNTDWLGS